MNWTTICAYEALLPERGVCALVEGTQVAIFRTYEGELYALGNLDPFSGAYVLSRGIVGTRKGEPTVASPLHKQVFSLVTGRCLDDETVSVPSYPVRVGDDGRVEVSLEQRVEVGV
ncbi:Nitrite reductase [NAD(P)H] small subunit [[Actinomadura] parvosata subsp. kistnae]|uniref:Nitrite reductase small subunit n=2 Tax=Nonomuraea TaxID=83681 RepID=A0A1V0AIQ7_9ACTN|nr:nitrite reductase small subunit NirD [Nonomuraea sp. ATCC 55076]AQZ69972.1 nitrite reductase small subunit [Nonomuraea sp. ATCC 55076]NJP93539.1 nitrite reductase small subunit NirD [Nonomuraea sp. FMUSA5-5]SPL90301.1 Nitrite reductase [NAD(P)H] small subunit [Actinomadura parvosata subsp. kistnae]